MKRHPPITYAPGHFTALMLKHDFPPGFKPQPIDKTVRTIQAMNEAAARSRQTALAKGITGTIAGISRDGRSGRIAGPVDGDVSKGLVTLPKARAR